MKCDKCGTPIIPGETQCRICGNINEEQKDVEVLGTVNPITEDIKEENPVEVLTEKIEGFENPRIENFNKEEILKEEVKPEPVKKKSKISQADSNIEMIIKNNTFNPLTIIIMILFIASLVLNLLLLFNKKDDAPEISKSNNETKEVYIDGYKYEIIYDWSYENTTNLVFKDKNNTWGASVNIPEMNFQNILANKADFYNEIKTDGFEITSDYEKEVNSTKNILFKGKYGEYNTYVIVTRLDDENVIITKVLYKTEVDDILLDNVLDMVTSITKVDDTIVTEDFSFKDISTTLKKLDVVKESKEPKEEN